MIKYSLSNKQLQKQAFQVLFFILAHIANFILTPIH